MNQDKRKKTFIKSTKKRRDGFDKDGKVRIDAVINKETGAFIDTLKEEKGYRSKGETIDYICSSFTKESNK